jgi:DnaJ family protein C protein 2
MKKYPASKFMENPGERWDKIVEEVPGKTKRDVKLRVKELQELIKSKKTKQ